MNRLLDIDGEKIILEEVAKNQETNSTLYRFLSDYRVCGAPLGEVKEKFPDYKPAAMETFVCSYLIAKDGDIHFYDPDGEPAEPIIEDESSE